MSSVRGNSGCLNWKFCRCFVPCRTQRQRFLQFHKLWTVSLSQWLVLMCRWHIRWLARIHYALQFIHLFCLNFHGNIDIIVQPPWISCCIKFLLIPEIYEYIDQCSTFLFSISPHEHCHSELVYTLNASKSQHKCKKTCPQAEFRDSFPWKFEGLLNTKNFEEVKNWWPLRD